MLLGARRRGSRRREIAAHKDRTRLAFAIARLLRRASTMEPFCVRLRDVRVILGERRQAIDRGPRGLRERSDTRLIGLQRHRRRSEQ